MTGLYVYGIVGGDHPQRLSGLTGVGGAQRPLRTVHVGDVTAVVSEAPAGLWARHQDLLAHHAVLNALVTQGAVLPMRFGTVAPDEASLRADLERGNTRYRLLLGELANRVELNVRVLPDGEQLLRQVAMEEPVMRRLRGDGVQTYERRLALGQVVAAALRRRQDELACRVLGALEPLAVRTVTGPPVAGCALNAGFLVDSGSADFFVDAVHELELALGDATRLRCTGPLPPYSFVTGTEG